MSPRLWGTQRTSQHSCLGLCAISRFTARSLEIRNTQLHIYVHVGHPVNEITLTQNLKALPKAVSLVFSTMCVDITGKSAPLQDEVSVERAIPLSSHWRGSFSSDPWWMQSEHRVHNKPSGLHIQQPFQTFPLQPSARDLHSQGRHSKKPNSSSLFSSFLKPLLCWVTAFSLLSSTFVRICALFCT